MKLARVVALVGVGVVLGAFTAMRSDAQQVSPQISSTTGVFTVGEQIELRPAAGFAMRDCTVARVSNDFIQCKEHLAEWWNSQQIVLVVRK